GIQQPWNIDTTAADEKKVFKKLVNPSPTQVVDLKKLAACEEVYFYCRGCSTKLTKAVRIFKEMPSVNWREAADNWFGTCCCSFGGVSEKLVAKYANLYTCSPGVCLLDGTSVVLCKDDFVGYNFPDQVESQDHKSLQLSADNGLRKDVLDYGITEAVNVDHYSQNKAVHDFDIKLNCSSPEDGDLTSKPDIKGTTKCPPDVRNNMDHGNECCHTHAAKDQTHDTSELLANKGSLLNGLLGNCFMVTSPYLSKDIKWSEISCPNCSCLLGAYPHDNIDDPLNGFNTSAPLNDGVHLFKCFISTCLPVGGPTDLFRKYTLERMFTSQLLESAKDELSFRTVIRNLQTRDPMLQIVLLNPNTWCSFGDCMDAMVPSPKINLYPVVKLLFSDCSNSTESQLRKLDQWATKNQVDDVYMLMSRALAAALEEANSMLPSSHACLQGLSLSFLRRLALPYMSMDQLPWHHICKVVNQFMQIRTTKAKGQLNLSLAAMEKPIDKRGIA
ncbi:zinc finger protein, partial [Tanacetum coccineum]